MDEWTINHKVAITMILFLMFMTVVSFLLLLGNSEGERAFVKIINKLDTAEYVRDGTDDINVDVYGAYKDLVIDKPTARNIIRSVMNSALVELNGTRLSPDPPTAYTAINNFIASSGNMISISIENDINGQVVLCFD